MYEINCLGDMCPVPLMKLQKELKTHSQLRLITDHSCVCESITNYCRQRRLKMSILEPINGVWEITVCALSK
ncbi:sulfurtransferase TusA family protein [Provencibacterium massiliense]|uniref:sulfurtransferase TusA family protein n=1 Tax=Provencibacterium massiliense TaxID=1841868 RepID=UPI0009A5F60C|nr:sulfurtransferase TusA family protein [Provencibacterium massiliense]RGB69729.1 sulfurtransferase TusA family protein [Harryflintia acetispora]